MTREGNKKTLSKINPKKMEKVSNKKRDENSEDDDSSYHSESEEEMDDHEYRKFLSKIFPSKHLNNKIRAGDDLKKAVRESDKTRNTKKKESESESESEESEAPKKTKASKKEDDNSGKFNIILTIDDEEEYYSDEEEDDEETEDEDEDVSSESESETEKVTTKSKPVKTKETEKNEKMNEFILTKLKELSETNKDNVMIQKCLEVCESDVKKKTEKKGKKDKKRKDKNVRIYKKITKDKNTMNDFAFFEKFEVDVQKKIIKELREINKIIRVEKPYRITLLESNMPTLFKSVALKKINSLRYMEPGSGEYYKNKNWVSTFMSIPFGNYVSLPINISDGVDKCHEFMENSQKILNDAVYGLNDAKMQIMQMLGQIVTNPESIGSAIAIHGPPGTGKTSLVKEGISKILGRPFAFIALGGATDSSFLEGHGYTYEGSTWGKIVQILIDSKCMNPVIYFDELDKISDTPKGEEIAGILTHLTDTTQNSQFHDKYFSDIDFDLSKCLFIFSYNDETKVSPILKDRMYRIQTKGYSQKQKTVISNQYLLPKIRDQVKFAESDIIIPDETLSYMVENLCNKEDGVRNLKRCLEIIYTKLNLYRLMKPGTNLFEEDMALKVEFPFTVTKNIVNKLVKRSEENSAIYSLYI